MSSNRRPNRVRLTIPAAALGSLVVFLTMMPTALAWSVNEGTPLVSAFEWAGSAPGSCGTLTSGLTMVDLKSGTGTMFDHLHVAHGSLGCTPPPAGDAYANNGANLSKFEWNHPTGSSYSVSVVWTISARVTMNQSLNGGCGRGALAEEFNLLNENTGSYLWPSNLSQSVFNTSFCGIPGHTSYSNTYFNTYNFTYSAGTSFTNGDSYRPDSYVHLWTYDGGGDVLVDCQSYGYNLTLDSFNAW